MFTRENLNRLHELTQDVADTKEMASELLRTAQDRYRTRTHKLEREGKTIELTEKVLWDEVFYLGADSQAGKLLAGVHPEVFEGYKKQDNAAAELKKFSVVELGIDYSQLTLSDYLKATESLFNLMMGERGMQSDRATEQAVHEAESKLQ